MSKIRRRDFIRSGMLAGGAVILGPRFTTASDIPVHTYAPPPTDAGIAVISGDDPVNNMPRLINALGGISQFVKQGQTVGLLANTPWKFPGYYTNPDVVLAVASLCRDAGAKEIVIFKSEPSGYWGKGKNNQAFQTLIDEFKYSTDRTEVEIPLGVTLKKAQIYSSLNSVDVFISIPVAKHHNGVIFSGNLKGLMGASSSNTNRYMHSPEGDYTYDKHEYLAQCIADLNTVRKPDLCVIDAIECATTNGPAGPGETVKPNKIIASRDPLASDVYAATLIGFDPKDILTFPRAYAHGLGEIDPGKLKIVEIQD